LKQRGFKSCIKRKKVRSAGFEPAYCFTLRFKSLFSEGTRDPSIFSNWLWRVII
jgi:hypothetical protein